MTWDDYGKIYARQRDLAKRTIVFKVVESLSLDPIRFPVKPGISLLSGNIVSVVSYKGDLVVDLCDGNYPFGLLENRCFGGNSVNFRQMARVYPQRMIVNLNRFDRYHEIIIGSSLYCNSKGILSSICPFENAFVLAKAITLTTSEKNHIQILWL